MLSPFPGMNPYLEAPGFWSSFHTRLIVAIADALAPSLRPRYYIEVETRTYQEWENGEDQLLVGVPDAAVLATKTSSASPNPSPERTVTLTHPSPQMITLPMPIVHRERYLEVRELGSEAVISVIEVLSPKNKQAGRGRDAYSRKREQILASLSHLIEIDLLRAYPPLPMAGQIAETDYRVVVSRSQERPQAQLYGFNLPEPIPAIPLPLKPDDPDLTVELQTIVQGVIERGGYDQRIDYRQPPPPPQLSTPEHWLEALLAPWRDGTAT